MKYGAPVKKAQSDEIFWRGVNVKSRPTRQASVWGPDLFFSYQTRVRAGLVLLSPLLTVSSTSKRLALPARGGANQPRQRTSEC
jgi:hypothetical protein